MTDVQHEKYARLIEEIEEIEARIAELAPDDPAQKTLQERLQEKETELARISKGCG